LKSAVNWHVRAVGPGGRQLAAYFYAEGAPRLGVWDLHTGQQEVEAVLERGAFRTVLHYFPSGRLLVVQAGRPPALWDLERSFRPLPCLSDAAAGRPYEIILASSADERLAATAGPDNQLILWDLETLRERRRSERFLAGIGALAFSPDGRTLAIYCVVGPKNLILWDLDAWTQRAVWTVPPSWYSPARSTLQFSADGDCLLIARREELRVVDVSTGAERSRLIWTFGEGDVFLGPDGRLALLSKPGGEIRLWPAEALTADFPA
jgi:WD40 repeat protein